MPIDVDKLSDGVGEALERAQVLAEQCGDHQIAPLHMLYALLDGQSALASALDRAGIACRPLRDAVAAKLHKQVQEPPPSVSKRPVASSSLRELIEKSFEKMGQRGGERAEPLDFLCAAVDFGDEPLTTELSRAGVTKQTVQKALESPTAACAQPVGGQPASSPAQSSGLKMLELYGRDLTALAAAGELMLVIGRDEEIRRVIQTLLRKSKNNPVLVGDPGTGKTAIAEGLALRIVTGDVPESLKRCKVFALDLTSMVAGAKYRGEFEERIKTVVDEVRSRKGEIVLFLDELHTLVGTGAPEGGMDAASILKPALARGELRCVAATTYDEYRERIEKDGALARRFDVVHVKEPTDEVMMVILRGIRTRFESFHGVRLTDEALQAAVKLSRRYMRDRCLPDKAIDVLDEAAARIRLQKESKPTHIDQRERLLVRKQVEYEVLQGNANTPAQRNAVAALAAELDELKPSVEKLVAEWKAQRNALDRLQKTKQAIDEQNTLLAAAEARGDVAKAAEIRYGSLKYLEEQRQDLEKKATHVQNTLVPDEVRPEHIAEVIADRIGVPIQRMLESERDRLLKMEERISQRVFGQKEAVHAVAEAARRMRADLQSSRKPSSFLFIGPTGVGKTELAKALAEALFDEETALIRIDMGEYKDKSSISGLIGSRPGLVGSEEGGFLTEQVRRSPYSVVLFDEVEKGHPEILDLLLSVLDEGRLTDAKGRFCDFSNTLILFTSNLGVREAMEMTDDPQKRTEIMLDIVKSSLRPELYNRISQVIPFNPLSSSELCRIVSVQLGALAKKLVDDRDIHLEVTPEALQYLAQQSYDPAYGARPVGRTLQQLVISPIATAVLAGDVSPGQSLAIAYSGEKGLTFYVREAPAALSPLQPDQASRAFSYPGWLEEAPGTLVDCAVVLAS